MIARCATELGLCKPRSGINTAAYSARLRTVRRGNFPKRSTGPGEFVPQQVDQLAPASIEDAAVQSRLGTDVLAWLFDSSAGASRHIADLKLLDNDDRVALAQPRRDVDRYAS